MKHNHFLFNSKKGFTLIELLVVISIIGLLASVILISFPSAMKGVRDATRKNDIHQIMVALEVYYAVYDEYPASGGASSPNGGWDNSNDGSWDNLESALTESGILPKDPLNEVGGWPGGGKYSYGFFSRGYGCHQQWYMIVYTLENKNDPDLLNSPGVTACNGSSFNYTGTVTIGRCHGCDE
jgi:prepilin-type N-terminal cleavage/methylation domain-containing protein